MSIPCLRSRVMRIVVPSALALIASVSVAQSSAIGSDAEIVAKLRARAFSAIDQSAAGRAQVFIMAYVGATCLSSAGVDYPGIQSLNASEVNSWAVNATIMDPPASVALRVASLRSFGLSSPAGYIAMGHFGPEPGCRDKDRARTAMNALDYLEEAALGRVPKEFSTPVRSAASLQASEEVGPDMRGAIYGVSGQGQRDEVSAQMNTLRKAGHRVRLCTYGPNASELASSRTFMFWLQKAPRAREQFLKVSPSNPLARLGNLAVVDCPSTAGEAERFLRRSWAAAFDGPSTAERWSCRQRGHKGTDRSTSVFVQNGFDSTSAAIVTFDVESKIAVIEVAGRKAELRKWDSAYASDSAGVPAGLTFYVHQNAVTNGTSLPVRYSLGLRRSTSEITERVFPVTLQPGRTPDFLSDLTLNCERMQ
jgi:hypothetical protein